MVDVIRPSASISSVPRGSFAPAGWEQAITNVLEHGSYSELSPFPPTMGLTKITGPKDGTHHASYMNLWGVKDPKTGTFSFSRITLVDEEWTLQADGKLHMDQWLHDLSPDGSTWRPEHKYMVRDVDGIVFDYGEYPQSAGDPRVSLQNLIAGWAKYQPTMGLVPSVDRMEAARHVAEQFAPIVRQPRGLTLPRAIGGFMLRPH